MRQCVCVHAALTSQVSELTWTLHTSFNSRAQEGYGGELGDRFTTLDPNSKVQDNWYEGYYIPKGTRISYTRPFIFLK